MFRELDALAAERGIASTRVMRQLLEAGLRDRDTISPPDMPSEDELLELLAEKARMGNVSAIRALLVREEQKDPRKQALALFEEMAARRQCAGCCLARSRRSGRVHRGVRSPRSPGRSAIAGTRTPWR